MEKEHGEPDRRLNESDDQAVHDWATRGISWLGKCGGIAAGYSAHAAEKAGSMFGAVGRLSVQALAKSGGAKNVLLVRTSDLAKTKSTSARDRRLQERVRLLRKDLSRLLRRKEAEVLALLRRKGDAWLGKAEVDKVEDTIRQHEVEVARLSEELKTLQAQREVLRVSAGVKGETECPASLPATQDEPIATVQDGERGGVTLPFEQTAAPEAYEPAVAAPPIESTDGREFVVAPVGASATDDVPVCAPWQVIAEDEEGGAALEALKVSETAKSGEDPGVVEEVQPGERHEPAQETVSSHEQVSVAQIEESRGVEHAPWRRPKRLSMEEIVQQAEFALASEKMAFVGVIRGVEAAGCLSESAAKKLNAIANPAVDQLFAVLAEHPHEATRARSVGALAERQTKDALPIFERAATDSSARVRAAALSGLYKLIGERAIPRLTRALKDEDPTVRHRVVMCLAWIGSRDVVPKLHELMTDDDASVRRAVVSALGTLKSEVSVPRVIEALDDEDVKVREAAHRTLKEVSRRNIAFNAQGALEERAKAKALWKAWWREQGASTEDR